MKQALQQGFPSRSRWLLQNLGLIVIVIMLMVVSVQKRARCFTRLRG